MVLVETCPSQRYGILGQVEIAKTTDNVTDDRSSMSQSHFVFDLFETFWCFKLDNFFSESQISPYIINPIVLALDFLSVQILSVSVDGSHGNC